MVAKVDPELMQRFRILIRQNIGLQGNDPPEVLVHGPLHVRQAGDISLRCEFHHSLSSGMLQS